MNSEKILVTHEIEIGPRVESLLRYVIVFAALVIVKVVLFK